MRVENEWFEIKCSKRGDESGLVEITCQVRSDVEEIDLVYQEKVIGDTPPLSHSHRLVKFYVGKEDVSLSKVLWGSGYRAAHEVNPVYYPIFLARLANSIRCIPVSIIMEECLYQKSLWPMSGRNEDFLYLVPPDEKFFERQSELENLQGELCFEHHRVEKKKGSHIYKYVDLSNDFTFPGYYHDLFTHEVDRLNRLLYEGISIDTYGLITHELPPFTEAIMFSKMVDYVSGDITPSELVEYTHIWDQIFE